MDNYPAECTSYFLRVARQGKSLKNARSDLMIWVFSLFNHPISVYLYLFLMIIVSNIFFGSVDIAWKTVF